jgi:hypothetical protein
MRSRRRFSNENTLWCVKILCLPLTFFLLPPPVPNYPFFETSLMWIPLPLWQNKTKSIWEIRLRISRKSIWKLVDLKHIRLWSRRENSGNWVLQGPKKVVMCDDAGFEIIVSSRRLNSWIEVCRLASSERPKQNIRDATIHNFTIRYISRYFIHDTIRITIHWFDTQKWQKQ